MASEYRRPKVYGNFKPSKSEQFAAKRAKKPASARRPGMSDDHLACIRKLPCCACLTVPAGEAHHLKAGTNERGTGMRSTDKWAVPLCRTHHYEIERIGSRNERSKFVEWRIIDALNLASDLWNATGDVQKMTKILVSHKIM
jgi:hypothetical protein